MTEAIAAGVPVDPSSSDAPACPRHGGPATFTCARCAGFGCWSCTVGTPWGPICPACHHGLVAAAGPGSTTTGEFTWEPVAGGSRRRAFTSTAWSLSFSPAATWPLVPMHGGAGPPTWFAVWANLLDNFWWIPGGLVMGCIEGFKDDGSVAKAVALATAGTAGTLVFVAVMTALAAISCPLELLLVRLLGGAAELPLLWRLWCYSQAPGLTGPVSGLVQLSCGLPISPVWSRYCRARGIERHCGLSFGRALVVTYLPLVGLFAVALGAAVLTLFLAEPKP